MKRPLLVPAILLMSFGLYAQTVQWATQVLDASSELTPEQYSAHQALGKPNVLPQGGQSPGAWSPDRPNRKEFIKVGFANPINIRQVAIAESHNPSALYRVLIYDENGGEHVVNTLNPRSVPLIKGRMLNFFMETTSFKVSAVKLEFDGAAVPDFFGIDAIGISDVNYPIIADIPQPALLASGIIVEALDANVNSDANELNPILSPDGKTMYFSRQNHPENIGGVNDEEDIWYSELDSTGHWSLAKNMGPQFNNEYPNFINSINSVSPDGKSAVMVLGNKYLDNGKVQAGVSISSNENGVWSNPVPLKITNDYNYNEKANYFLTNDRRTILMSVERADSYGDRDIYVSFMGTDSVWSEPLNIGSIVNSASEESGPFLAVDGKTLYYSSKGFSGYGGSDIYVTTRLDDTWTNWSEPQNLGPEINSPLEDLFFNIPANSDYAYYSRSVSDNNADIYRVNLPIMKEPEIWVTVKGKLVDAKTGEPISAKVIFEKLPEGQELGVVQPNPETGEFQMKLLAGNLYGVRGEAEGHLSESQNIDLRNVKSEMVLGGKDLQLEPIAIAAIEENAKIVLNNVFFDFDKSVLKPESFPELDRLVKLMGERETMTVEIAGHTDAVGTEEYNMGLSRRRSNAVQQYLTGKGVKSARIKVSYFGESQPAATNDTDEGREKNRRVEFKIIKT